MTILRTFLARGYFPKELPPAFFTDQFAAYANTRGGRKELLKYKPHDDYTDTASYVLALPGSLHRQLRVPHPATFATLARIVAKNLKRLLKKSGASSFSRSRPVYATGHHRALHTSTRGVNLERERANSRAGASFLLKADVSQFYPSLYTHAVGWAVDPAMRKKINWHNKKLLGKKLDSALMNLQGKVSQGIPIGNDISYLLSEIVLNEVDSKLDVPHANAYRWFDDYELAFDTREQAERARTKLTKALEQFKLRLNPGKTAIFELPMPSQDEWRDSIFNRGKVVITTDRDMVHYFDHAFSMRTKYPGVPVLQYALGMLFNITVPNDIAGKSAQSCISQCILAEPGCAQKAFALLTYWRLNGLTLDNSLLSRTGTRIVERHEAGGVTSDVAWALAFCLDNNLTLGRTAGRVLSELTDGFVTILALDLHSRGLIPEGFTTKRISKALTDADLDSEYWLVAYESVRHGFLNDSAPAIASNDLFADFLKRKVTFYRRKLPSYASIVHPGGAPEWVVNSWLARIMASPATATSIPTWEAVRADVSSMPALPTSHDDVVSRLLDNFTPENLALTSDSYSRDVSG